MDLYQLECFRVVASMQHISNAAMVLHITQSALSKIINRVEDYAGMPAIRPGERKDLPQRERHHLCPQPGSDV